MISVVLSAVFLAVVLLLAVIIGVSFALWRYPEHRPHIVFDENGSQQAPHQE